MNFIDKEQIIFVGDVHGKFSTLEHYLHDRYKIENSIIIICGDFGIGFNKHNYYIDELNNKLNNKLLKFNNHLIVVRGNHDDPKYFNNSNEFGSNIILVKDYSIININGYNILCLGGAISVDRRYRIKDKTWRKDEKFILNKELLSTISNIDYIVSHTSPQYVFPYIPYIDDEYPILTHELARERLDMNEAYDILSKNNNISKWFYGHFHSNQKSQYNNTRFYCLNELNFETIYLNNLEFNR